MNSAIRIRAKERVFLPNKVLRLRSETDQEGAAASKASIFKGYRSGTSDSAIRKLG